MISRLCLPRQREAIYVLRIFRYSLSRSEEHMFLLGHVAHENDHWHHCDGFTESLAIFRGPYGYVSPSWYLSGPSVPTWNYAVVHVYGYPRATRDRQITSVGRVHHCTRRRRGCGHCPGKPTRLDMSRPVDLHATGHLRMPQDARSGP